ncbi:MAG: hypothetical protein ACI4PK_02840 [Oscillospiraceae bacterium]
MSELNEENNQIDSDSLTISQRDLSLLTGIAKTTIQNLAAKGVLPRDNDGKLLRDQSLEILNKKKINHKKKLSDRESAQLLLRSRALKAKEAAKLEAKKNKIAEISILEKEKILIAVDNAFLVFSRVCENVKSELENLPARLALELEGKSAAIIEKVLRNSIAEVLSSISEEKKKKVKAKLTEL